MILTIKTWVRTESWIWQIKKSKQRIWTEQQTYGRRITSQTTASVFLTPQPPTSQRQTLRLAVGGLIEIINNISWIWDTKSGKETISIPLKMNLQGGCNFFFRQILNIFRYLKMLSCKGVDALKWRELQKANFPALSKMAIDFLAIPGSSVPFEWLFSIAGEVISSKHSRLTPETAQALICTHSWYTSGILSFDSKLASKNAMKQYVGEAVASDEEWDWF